MYVPHLYHSTFDGHLGCYHVLPIVNSAAINVGVHVSFGAKLTSVSQSPLLNELFLVSFLKLTLNILFSL